MIQYRQFEPGDAEPCRRLILACLDDLVGLGPGARDALRRRITVSPYAMDLARAFCLIAADGDQVAGIGALDDTIVKRMYVDPRYRCQGIGRAIHDRLEAEAVRRGVTALQLEASLNAVRFYLRLGYEIVEEKTWQVDGAVVRSTMMRKPLLSL
jgi:GNAT superfamily N-acetyltransferase